MAALVVALTVFAASPAAHAWLHKDSSDSTSPISEDTTCAVLQFAGGVSVPLEPIAVEAPSGEESILAQTPARELQLVAPRYLRQPERGPPTA